jgi:GT2 family glycosyltransferase
MNPSPPRLYHCHLGASLALVWMRMEPAAAQPVEIWIHGERCMTHSGILHTPHHHYAYALVHNARLGGSLTLALDVRLGSQHIAEATFTRDGGYELFLQLVTHIDHADRLSLWHDWMQWSQKIGIQTAGFGQLCEAIVRHCEMPVLNLQHHFQLNPHIFYLEGEMDEGRPRGNVDIVAFTDKGPIHGACRFMQLSETGFALIALFLQPATAINACFFISEAGCVRIDDRQPLDATGDRLLHHLNEKHAYQKQALRQLLCTMLVDHSEPSIRPAIADIINKLQHYIRLPIVNCTDAQLPFNMHIETLIPIGQQGIFLSGWMRDPLHLLDSLTIHSPLGISLAIEETLFHTKRPDVAQHYAGTPYAPSDDKLGIISYLSLPDAERERLEGLGDLHAWHLVANLNNGIRYEIHPEQKQWDPAMARDIVTKIVPTNDVTDEMLTYCIGPAASLLQQQVMQLVSVRNVYHFGPIINHPLLSLCIPLYERFDFLSVQCASFAADPVMKDVEIIYILDSPWAEAEVHGYLQQLTSIYPLSVQLIVMERNSGYAAASNTGADHTRGDYLIMLNSDVFPREKGWALSMLDYYKANPHIGALAPKLLYEDDSVQHAGMYFSRQNTADWLNLHYYKGYPRHYPPLTQSRAVPAVTGACLMMSREKWRLLGGFSTDYVIGDFEDSDLCLKALQHGWESHYFANAELYHLERQSVPLNSSYTASVAWRYNARLHTQRWDILIQELMQEYKDLAA